jgi:hypothetical protein
MIAMAIEWVLGWAGGGGSSGVCLAVQSTMGEGVSLLQASGL